MAALPESQTSPTLVGDGFADVAVRERAYSAGGSKNRGLILMAPLLQVAVCYVPKTHCRRCAINRWLFERWGKSVAGLALSTFAPVRARRAPLSDRYETFACHVRNPLF